MDRGCCVDFACAVRASWAKVVLDMEADQQTSPARAALATVEQKLAEATQRRDIAEREVVELTASRDSLQQALEGK